MGMQLEEVRESPCVPLHTFPVGTSVELSYDTHPGSWLSLICEKGFLLLSTRPEHSTIIFLLFWIKDSSA